LSEELADTACIERHTAGFESWREIVAQCTPEQAAEATGIAASEIRRLAHLYASTRPAAILTGMGVQYYRHGGATMRAIDALGVITGNIGIPGGGVSFDFSSRSSFDYRAWMGMEHVRESRSIPRPRLGAELRRLATSGTPIRSAWFTAANPVTQSPDSQGILKALESVEFKVTITPFDSDTARASDLVLPASTFLEKEDVRGTYWQPWVGFMNKVVEPLGESLSETEIFRLLGERMGICEQMSGDWVEASLSPVSDKGLNKEWLRENGGGRSPMVPVVPFEDGTFPSESGKFQFLTALPVIDRQVDPAFPYILLTPKAKGWHNSNLWKADHPTLPTAYIHPDSGKPDNRVLCIESRTGVLRVLLKHNADVCRGTVMVYQGSNVDLGGGVNVLTTDELTDLGDCACFGETRVRVVVDETTCGCR
ncbi:MAG: molybdopterin-dependent oxidoreductase, partial [Nitrospirota bacterium]|nr:molybdopterin-dependent oxidoreductase [Nitrospirota bacterium]